MRALKVLCRHKSKNISTSLNNHFTCKYIIMFAIIKYSNNIHTYTTQYLHAIISKFSGDSSVNRDRISINAECRSTTAEVNWSSKGGDADLYFITIQYNCYYNNGTKVSITFTSRCIKCNYFVNFIYIHQLESVQTSTGITFCITQVPKFSC